MGFEDGAGNGEKSSKSLDRIAVNRLLEQFHASLEEGRLLVRGTTPSTPAQIQSLKKLVERARESGEAMSQLHSVFDDPNVEEDSLRILRGARRTYDLLKKALNTTKKAFGVVDSEEGL